MAEDDFRPLRDLSRTTGDADGRFSLRVNLDGKDLPGEALVAYDATIRLRPEDPAAWCNRGVALADMGCHEEACGAFEHGRSLQVGGFAGSCG
jgi:hypothetical protein